jgi:hypothetical protein
MSDVFDEQGEINWKTIIDRLQEGKVVEIPCRKEREFVRRAKQVVKRAEKQNLAVEVLRNEQGLRVEPRAGAASLGGTAEPAGGNESREKRQLERAQRREARRADHGADRDRDR